MKYFKVTSEKEADTLSTTMYKMMYPENKSVSTTHLFDWLTNDNGDVIIRVPEDTFPVFKKTDYTSGLTKIEECTGSISTKIKSELNTGKISPIKLLGTLEEVDYQYLLDNGFIKISKSPIE